MLIYSINAGLFFVQETLNCFYFQMLKMYKWPYKSYFMHNVNATIYSVKCKAGLEKFYRGK